MNPDPPSTLVVVDTDVFSQVFVSTSGPRHRDLHDRLVGQLPVVPTQTHAELLAWPRLAGWGPSRTGELDRILTSTTVVPVTPEAVEAYVDPVVECKRRGHAFGQKIHTADRWVAATATALGRPLLTLDRIYSGAPGLVLV